MGDARFADPYRRLRAAEDRAAALLDLTDEETVQALADASRHHDPYLANVLATEAMNRMVRARTLLASMPEGVCAIDETGRVRDANEAALRMLGRDRQDLVGLFEHETFHFLDAKGDPIPPEKCRFREVLSSGRVVSFEDEPFLRADGSRLPVSVLAAPIVIGEEIRGAVLSFRDITHRRRLEAEHARWHAVVTAFYDLHDRLGFGLGLVEGEALEHTNGAFGHIVGRSWESLRAVPSLLDLVAPEERKSIVAHSQEILQNPRMAASEQRVRFLRPDGTLVPCRLYLARVEGAEGEPRVAFLVRALEEP